NGDDLIFPLIAANRTNTNNMTGLVVNTLTVGGTDYVIGGNSITLTNFADGSTAGANVVNLPLNVTGTLTATVSVANTTSTLGVGAGLVSFSSLTMTGGSITAAGTGEVQFRGDGTFTPSALGGSTISGGHVQLLTATRTLTVNDSAAVNDLVLATEIRQTTGT